jgi:hypothetical protein
MWPGARPELESRLSQGFRSSGAALGRQAAIFIGRDRQRSHTDQRFQPSYVVYTARVLVPTDCSNGGFGHQSPRGVGLYGQTKAMTFFWIAESKAMTFSPTKVPPAFQLSCVGYNAHAVATQLNERQISAETGRRKSAAPIHRSTNEVRARVGGVAIEDGLVAYEELNPGSVRDGDCLRPDSAVTVRHRFDACCFFAAHLEGAGRKGLGDRHRLRVSHARQALSRIKPVRVDAASTGRSTPG